MAKHGKNYKAAAEPRSTAPSSTRRSRPWSSPRSSLPPSSTRPSRSPFRLGIDTRKADQNVRGSISLPHGTGKSVRVAVFAEGEKAREAEEAGADVVGSDDLVAQVQAGEHQL